MDRSRKPTRRLRLKRTTVLELNSSRARLVRGGRGPELDGYSAADELSCLFPNQCPGPNPPLPPEPEPPATQTCTSECPTCDGTLCYCG